MKTLNVVIFLVTLLFIQPLVFAQTLNLVYDQNGNLVTGDGVFRVYNSLNQLWKVYNGSSSSGTLLLQYVYHPVEERVYYKTRYFTGGNETTIYINENYVRVVNSSGNFDYTYVFHEGQQVAQLLPSGTKQYIHGNHEGSSSVLTNSSGGVVERTDYTPFGEISSGGSKTRFDYENKEFDSNLESFDFHFRQYKPEWGLFTQPDTLIQNIYNPQSLNRYMFERGNPYGRVDPSGHFAEIIIFELLKDAVLPLIIGSGLAWLGITILGANNAMDNAEINADQTKDETPKIQAKGRGLDGKEYDSKEDWLDNELPRDGEYPFTDPSPKKRGGDKYKYDEEGNPVDSKGKSWKPDRIEGHWDVQEPNGGHTRVTTDGRILGISLTIIFSSNKQKSSKKSTSSRSNSNGNSLPSSALLKAIAAANARNGRNTPVYW